MHCIENAVSFKNVVIGNYYYYFSALALGRFHYKHTYVLNVVLHLVYWKYKSF